MKNRPLHENLDTSFVNLSALVRYLRRRQFAGNIRVELSGYEADIVLTKENQMNVREYDRIAGRIAEGEEALQRLLIRAREPGGIIHVYQHVAETEKPIIKNEPLQKEEVKLPKAAVKVQETAVAEIKQVVVNAPPVTAKFVQTETPSAVKVMTVANAAEKVEVVKQAAAEVALETKAKPKLPDFPFELSNNFEAKAKKNQLSADDWQMLLNLTGELLKTVDDCLAKANLDFAAAFQKAGAEVSADYPFLNPNSENFAYQSGQVRMNEQTNAKIFVAGINESLRRILEKLGASAKFSEVHRYAVHKIIALIHQRKPLYDKFFITPQLEKILGI